MRGGFGTPYFGDDVQVSVTGATLHVVRGGERASTPLTSLAAAAAALGDLLDPAPQLADDAARRSTRPRPRVVGDWFGFAFSVLEELRARAGEEHAPSRVQIWPEHFDAALELGDDDAGARAAYGCSPGDEHHPEPYLYVAPWTARPTGELWQAAGFPGAELAYAELLAAADPRALALRLLRGAAGGARRLTSRLTRPRSGRTLAARARAAVRQALPPRRRCSSCCSRRSGRAARC